MTIVGRQPKTTIVAPLSMIQARVLQYFVIYRLLFRKVDEFGVFNCRVVDKVKKRSLCFQILLLLLRKRERFGSYNHLQAKITKMSISTNSNNWHYVLVFIRLEYNDFNFSLTNARQHGRPSPVFTRTARITGVKSRTSISLRHNFYSHFKIINFLVGVKGVVRGTAPAFAPLLDRTRIRAQPSSSALWSASHVPASRLRRVDVAERRLQPRSPHGEGVLSSTTVSYVGCMESEAATRLPLCLAGTESGRGAWMSDVGWLLRQVGFPYDESAEKRGCWRSRMAAFAHVQRLRTVERYPCYGATSDNLYLIDFAVLKG